MKQQGQHTGPITRAFMDVLRALLYGFHNDYGDADGVRSRARAVAAAETHISAMRKRGFLCLGGRNGGLEECAPLRSNSAREGQLATLAGVFLVPACRCVSIVLPATTARTGFSNPFGSAFANELRSWSAPFSMPRLLLIARACR